MTFYPTGALPMPHDGQRRLTPSEAQRRAEAMACLRDKSSECQGQVHVNLFFDGTGNNWKWEGTFHQQAFAAWAATVPADVWELGRPLWESAPIAPSNDIADHLRSAL
ncbi:hypothetical protein BRM22_24285 [Xanthomonas oryzae pv. oryzae]|uniref:hypothetical protein n=3 Tax=Xanthomonas oryzae TaxID=347 RepID=UPI000655B755|nr:hypothetical protein [Xanthomonas oryzae]AKO01573.1 hypothetical protein ACU15_14760 [Xanthomonas oryzae pv. oryzicola]AXM10750.1 hypothetical protein BRM60_18430 [Xanthomonas oryzae pv. oryzae]AXM14469.1 hypothetical protein BRN32_18585 [Xanthomonas oryzae pv. oryzae]AXM18204.1 hypothetical protein BRN66_18190 [Xanthomonas oryzae pv. oryzae]AXM22063.1 hypothetical protein BRM88_18720 [Xanthomonas oryzae pv. oryzae]